MPETARLIIETAIKEGFTGAGIAPVSETALQPLSDWLAKGYNAGMEYMGRNIRLRENPAGLLEGARSIMVFTMPYPDSITGKSGEKYAGFAIGKDYHYIIKERLSRIAGTCLPSGSRYRVFWERLERQAAFQPRLLRRLRQMHRSLPQRSAERPRPARCIEMHFVPYRGKQRPHP